MLSVETYKPITNQFTITKMIEQPSHIGFQDVNLSELLKQILRQNGNWLKQSEKFDSLKIASTSAAKVIIKETENVIKQPVTDTNALITSSKNAGKAAAALVAAATALSEMGLQKSTTPKSKETFDQRRFALLKAAQDVALATAALARAAKGTAKGVRESDDASIAAKKLEQAANLVNNYISKAPRTTTTNQIITKQQPDIELSNVEKLDINTSSQSPIILTKDDDKTKNVPVIEIQELESNTVYEKIIDLSTTDEHIESKRLLNYVSTNVSTQTLDKVESVPISNSDLCINSGSNNNIIITEDDNIYICN